MSDLFGGSDLRLDVGYPTGFLGGGDMFKADNLAGLLNFPLARANLGLGGFLSSNGYNYITGPIYDTSRAALQVGGGTSGYTLFLRQVANTPEGGQIALQLPDTGSTLGGDLIIDLNANSLRFFESAGATRGASLDLTTCTSLSTLLHTDNLAANLKFKPSGSLAGSVTALYSTLVDKTLYADNFNATFSGDDSLALKNLFAAAVARGGARIVISGRCNYNPTVNGPISIPINVPLIIDGLGSGSIVSTATDGTNLFELGQSGTLNQAGITFVDIQIVGTGTTAGGTGINGKYCSSLKFNRVKVYNHAGGGIAMDNCYAPSFIQTSIGSNLIFGLKLWNASANAAHFSHTFVGNHNSSNAIGIWIGGTIPTYNPHLDDLDVENNTIGLRIGNTFGAVVSNGYWENCLNGQQEILTDAGCIGLSVAGNTFYGYCSFLNVDGINVDANTWLGYGQTGVITNVADFNGSTRICLGQNTFLNDAFGLRGFVNVSAAERMDAAKTYFALTSTITSVARASNVATIGTSASHNLAVGQLVYLTPGSDQSFAGNYKVTGTPTATNFTVANSGANKSTTSETGTARCTNGQVQMIVTAGGVNQASDIWAIASTGGTAGLHMQSGTLSTGFFQTASEGTLYTAQAQPISIWNNNARRLTVSAIGQVNINTTTISARLGVQGIASETMFAGLGAAGNIYIDYNGSGSNYIDGGYLYLRTFAGTNKLFFDIANGRIGIGASPGFPFDNASGSMRVYSSTGPAYAVVDAGAGAFQGYIQFNRANAGKYQWGLNSNDNLFLWSIGDSINVFNNVPGGVTTINGLTGVNLWVNSTNRASLTSSGLNIFGGAAVTGGWYYGGTGGAGSLFYDTSGDLVHLASLNSGVSWKPLRLECAGLQVYAASGASSAAFNSNGSASITGAFTATGLTLTTSSAPATSSATGTTGTITWDGSYMYVCTATNTWKRAAISTW